MALPREARSVAGVYYYYCLGLHVKHPRICNILNSSPPVFRFQRQIYEAFDLRHSVPVSHHDLPALK